MFVQISGSRVFCRAASLRAASLGAASLGAALLFTGCVIAPALPSASGTVAQSVAVHLPATEPVNPFSKVVVLGDSLSAGFQNGSLLDTQQPNGWASLVARQAGFQLTLPLIAPPGFPAVSRLVTGSLPPVLQQAPGISIGRDHPEQQVDDLAVPGHTLHDLLNTAPEAQAAGAGLSMTSLVLGYPAGTEGTQLQQAIARQPSTIFVWIGGNDAVIADGTGDPKSMTPLPQFTRDFTELMASLKANTNAHLVVANVPDPTKIPYLTQASEILYEYGKDTGVSTAVLSTLLRIYPGDLVKWQGLVDIQANLKRMEANQYPVPIPPSEVLSVAKVAEMQSTVDSYNQVIAQQVAAMGGTLVDVHGYLDLLADKGVTINNYQASTLYLGGIFGLDGIHFSDTGYALLANRFIASTNTALGTSIPLVDVGAVAAKDPYFGPNRQNLLLPYVQPHISPEVGTGVDSAIFHDGKR